MKSNNKPNCIKLVNVFLLVSFFVTALFSFGQSIPSDSLYLGQTPPDNIPQKFNCLVNAGSFAAERIAISNDKREIYYSEVKNYYPATGDTIKYYIYRANKWNGPYNLFAGYLSPTLSLTGDTMYFETAGTSYETFMSVRNGNEWSEPQRILNNLNSAHYLQFTSKGNSYISSMAANSVGANDWCLLTTTDTSSIASSLGCPLNTEWDNLDYFMASDESFMLVTTLFGLAISYPKANGEWSSPRNLGDKINFGLACWGPYVTPDRKYLFYSTGTKPDYSDTGIYWVRIDSVIDSLKSTNNVPYLNKKLEKQAGTPGELFTFSIPESTFCDDDGTTQFTYSAMLNTGQPIPAWLSIDNKSGSFTGTPLEKGDYTIIIMATDNANATGTGVFHLTITDNH